MDTPSSDTAVIASGIASSTTSHAGEVQADSSGKWYGSALRFATEREAELQIADLPLRWAAVRDTRVVPSEDPPNYRWDSTIGLVQLAMPG